MKMQATLLAVLMSGTFGQAQAADKFIILQSTTSTQNSGLFDHLLPVFKADTGIDVRVVAVGTGQALKNAQNCDGDVVLVHAKAAEDKFVADGFGVKRTDVMYNDFVVVGPANDPAGVAGSKEVVKSFKAIADKKALFASRGDDSGTHKKEQELWKAANVDVKAASGKWRLPACTARTRCVSSCGSSPWWVSMSSSRLRSGWSLGPSSPGSSCSIMLWMVMRARISSWLNQKPGSSVALSAFSSR